MKKTQTVNIGGIAFILDEDAFILLSKYLDSIEKQYLNKDEQAEIMEDIEARIAELFKAELKNASQVITIREVEKVMNIIGNPIEFNTEENSYKKKEPSYSQKRLYRDPDNRILGGVCSGLGDYFNIDPLIIRVLFLVAFLGMGIGLLVYIALWILTPEADVYEKKNDVTNQPGARERMENFVKQEYEQVKTNWNKRFKGASI
ncbi:MAG: PspC domain-containing protein [Bacteroidales bacterium]|nr:PspC domain-containing protein [Bacteroidales bacterium]